AAAAQPADLGPGRGGRTVPRHQGHRPGADRAGAGRNLGEGELMSAHVRANLWLLLLTLAVCCVLYPLALWAVGQGVFPDRASGSLVTGADGKVVGSRLIAQPFSDAKYFQPRPSAVSYNAAASGGSNLAASNPKLRGRVAQALGLIARY